MSDVICFDQNPFIGRRGFPLTGTVRFAPRLASDAVPERTAVDREVKRIVSAEIARRDLLARFPHAGRLNR